MQPSRTATECEVDLARKRPGRAIGLRPWIPKQPLEFSQCATESHPLTQTSPCEVHGISAGEKVIIRKQLRRSQVLAFFEALSPCLIGMEACATAHYWARELTKLGHQVRLMPAKDVKAYVKRNKNDAADAEAICEAVRRPTMRFVQIKPAEQQGRLMLHRTRDLLMRQRTQLINALRAHLAELGIVAAQGNAGLKELLRHSLTRNRDVMPPAA